jgi:hypothetical protein
LIVGYSISEMLVSLSYFIMGAVNYFMYYFQIPVITEEIVCDFIMLPNRLFHSAACHYLLILTFDRCLCIVKPVQYKIMNSVRYLVFMNLVIFVCCVITEPVAFSNSDHYRKISFCDAFASVDSKLLLVTEYEQMFVGVLVTVIYLAAALGLWWKYKVANFIQESQKSEWRRKFELDVFKSFLSIGLFNGFILIATRVVQILNTYFSMPFATRILSCINSMSHLIFYLCFNSTFRSEFLKLGKRMKKKWNASPVTPTNF